MIGTVGRRMGERIVPLRDGEGTTAVMMFAYSFLAMTAYNILKPITRSQFITALGADNLPYVQLAAGVCIGILMQLYGRAVARVPRRWVIPVTQAGEAALLVVFWLLFRTGAQWVSAAFYVLALILGILLTSQFWTLANDIYDPRHARRLFGFIGGGASLGGAVGAGLTSLSVAALGTTNLLLVSAALLGGCALLVAAVIKREQPESDAGSTAEQGVGGGKAIRMLRSSRHLQLIALVIAFAAIGAAIIEQQLNMAAESVKGGSPDAMTAFLAQITFYLSLVGFLVQVVLTTRVHRSLGLAVALLILPFSLGTSAVIILWTGALWATAVARVLDTSLRYTIDKTTREVLFLPLPADLKYRAKPFVDVTVDRSAKAMGALLTLVLIKPWGLHFGWQRLSYASLVVSVVWIALALRARGEYLKAFRRSIQSGSLASEQVRLRLNPADAGTLELLVQELSSTDESRVLYAIDTLDALGKPNLVTPLLLHHDSARVRARVLATLPALPAAARWAPAVHRMLSDSSPDVRAAAVQALAAVRADDGFALMRQYLHATESRVSISAAVVLADSPDSGDAHAAEAALVRVVDRGGVGARKDAAAALAHVANPRCRALLVPLIQDGDVEVARTAMSSAKMLGPVEVLFVPALISRLAHRVLKPFARDVLVGYGEEVVDVLAFFLADTGEDEWVRRHVPATLARIPVQRSMDALLNALPDPDGFLRYKILVALERLQADCPELTVDSQLLQRVLLAEAARHDRYVALRAGLPEPPAVTNGLSVLERALDEKIDRTRDRIYRLLVVLNPRKDVDAVRHALQHGSPRTRAAAIEYIDNLLRGPLRKRIVPILEQTRSDVHLSSRSHHPGLHSPDAALTSLERVEDPEIAAIAIRLAERHGLRSTLGDADCLPQHDCGDERLPGHGTTGELAASSRRLFPGRQPADPLLAVDIVEDLSRMPIFAFASVDELFRIAQTGRQVILRPGQRPYREGDIVREVLLLLEGRLTITRHQSAQEVTAPAALTLFDILEDRRIRHTVTVREPAVCLSLHVDQFLTMLSDNVALAQGLFSAIVGGDGLRRPPPVYPARGGAEPIVVGCDTLQAMEKDCPGAEPADGGGEPRRSVRSGGNCPGNVAGSGRAVP
jgi:ATP:ADP antiporter, AAA family